MIQNTSAFANKEMVSLLSCGQFSVAQDRTPALQVEVMDTPDLELV